MVTNPDDFVHVAITFADGSCRIMSFLTRGSSPTLPSGAEWIAPGVWRRDAIDSNIFSTISQAAFGEPQAVSFRVLPEKYVPGDQAYHAARIDNGTSIVYRMDIARGIRLEKLRKARESEFARLDAEWMRATGQGRAAEVARIEAERQALRDMPARVAPLLESAQTIADLEAVR